MPWLVRTGLAFVAVLVVMAAGAPWIAPHDPVRQSLRARLQAPSLTPAPDGKVHLLGTDHLGRDVLSRIVFGARVSLTIGFAAVVVGGLWARPSACWRASTAGGSTPSS